MNNTQTLKNVQAPTLEVFEAQKAYMERLIERGVLPHPHSHLDLDDPDTQSFIRETIGYLFEEIGEAEEQLNLIYERLEDNDMDGATLALKDYNEETADCLAFFIELFTYARVEIDTIFDSMDMIANHLNIDPIFHRLDLFKQALELGKNAFQREVGISNEWQIKAYHFNALPVEDYLTNGARILGNINLTFHKNCIYDCHLFLAKALNCLKNKPWKSTQTETDLNSFENNISMAFLEYMASLSCLQFRATQLSRLVLHKIQINNDRLDEKEKTNSTFG